jgi:hypothetical protein
LPVVFLNQFLRRLTQSPRAPILQPIPVKSKTTPINQRTFVSINTNISVKVNKSKLFDIYFYMEETSKIYDLLLRVKNGYNPGWSTYFSRYDDILDDIRFNDKSPGSSTVVIRFMSYDDYFKLFDEDELYDEDIRTIQYFLNNQWENDYDTYELSENWDGGHLQNYFNEENLELINNIVSILSNNSLKMSFEQKSQLIHDNFSDEVESITSEWSEIEHNCKISKIQELLYEEFGNQFYTMGIREESALYKYRVTVNSLIKLFNIFKLQDKNISDVLKEIIKINGESHGDNYNEMYWHTGCEDFDEESFNRDANRYLTKIYDKILDDDKYVDVYEYFHIKELIEKEYGFDKWNKINTKDDLYFNINEINPETNKINITIRSKNGDEDRSVTYDELIRLQTQYELFNEIRKIQNKIFLI